MARLQLVSNSGSKVKQRTGSSSSPLSSPKSNRGSSPPLPSLHVQNREEKKTAEEYANEQKERALKELHRQKEIVINTLKAERAHPDNAYDKITKDVEENANAKFPGWMQSRSDFQTAFPRFATRENADRVTLANISMAKSPEIRTSWDTQNLLAFVEKFPLFQNLDKELCEVLCKMFKAVDFPPGYTIFSQGDDGTTYYMILEGTVDIVKDGETVCVCERGDAFGELAIFASYNDQANNDGLGHRAASAITNHGKVRAIELRAFDFREAKKAVRQSKCKEWLEFLCSSCPIFKGWSRVRLYHLVQEMQSKQFAAGDVVLGSGSSADEMYFLQHGKCAAYRDVECTITNRWPVSKSGEHGEAETTFTRHSKIADLDQGDYFGEEVLFDNAERLCSVRAETPVTVLALKAVSAKSLLPAKTVEQMQNSHADFQASDEQVRDEHVRRMKARTELKRLRDASLGPKYKKRGMASSASAPSLRTAAASASKGAKRGLGATQSAATLPAISPSPS